LGGAAGGLWFFDNAQIRHLNNNNNNNTALHQKKPPVFSLSLSRYLYQAKKISNISRAQNHPIPAQAAAMENEKGEIVDL
jgi:hypothetical protein